MVKLSLLLLSMCIVLNETQSARNPYCAAGLCAARGQHIACGNNGRFKAQCPRNARMVRLARFRQQILYLHNSHRNLIASGRLVGYKAARRMATMQWDNELASLAALNVKQCQMRHDKCRNTKRFSKSGQNLAMISYDGPENRKPISALIRTSVMIWWREYRQCNMRIINRYPKNYKGPDIGHFTVFVADKNIRVGCAAARFTKGKSHSFLFACNYATTNIVNEPIYVSGKAASGCRTGRNRRYRSLCSRNERYAELN